MRCTGFEKAEGWLSQVFVIVLLLVAVGLYLGLVMVDRKDEVTPQTASLQIVEEPGAQADPAQATQLRELPQDQWQLLVRVFAPEMLESKELEKN